MNKRYSQPFRGIIFGFEGAAFDLSKDPAFLAQQKMIQGLATIVQQQVTQNANLQTAIADLAKAGGVGRRDEPPPPKDDDINSLDNVGFQKLLLTEVGKLLDAKLGEVSSKVDSTTREFRSTRIKDEVNAFAGTHKDFNDWSNELTALSKQHPTLGVPELYTLARNSNPDKAKELDTKYADPKDDKKDDGLSLFGGFRPSIGNTGNDGGKDDKKTMTVEEAFEAAWNESVERVPSLAKLNDVPLD